jgi:ribonucleotide monophosphatase NagD (HAD superfamily)
VGRKVWFIGENDQPSSSRPRSSTTRSRSRRVPLNEAEGIVCTGPFDRCRPFGLRPQFLGQDEGLKLLCANPDIVVDRGESGNGARARWRALYTEMGGESLYFGKPHPPIYDLARRRLAEAGGW